MELTFSENNWSSSSFTQVTSAHTDGRQPFMQENDCIVNDFPRGHVERVQEYNYISLLAKEMLHTGDTVETVCSFEAFGAPLIVLTDDLRETEDGYPLYGHHYEIVAFEEGYNVWNIDGKPVKAAFGRFPVAAGEKLTLKVRVLSDGLEITLNGHTERAEIPGLPTEFRAGITACEGVNRFYSYRTEKG